MASETEAFETALEMYDEAVAASSNPVLVYRARRLLIAEARGLVRAVDKRLAAIETILRHHKWTEET